MKKNILLTLAFLITTPLISHADTTVLYDDFSGTSVNSNLWHIPTWVSPDDGTFLGRTQLRVTQNSPLPTITNGNVNIEVQSYNPIAGVSFYGTDLISDEAITLNEGVRIKVRAKVNAPARGGTVAGIFLYDLKDGSNTLHDEIDFELLGNRPNAVNTNIYSNEPLGAGHPTVESIPTGSITDYHIYEILWLPNEVSWYIDGNLVRTRTSNVPQGPMSMHLNMWVPAAEWADAYDATLVPVTSLNQNQIYSMSVDYVDIQAISSEATLNSIDISPLLNNLTIGGTKQLTAVTLDQNGNPFPTTLTWSSSNTSVATVNSSGVVTAVGLGTANITASSGNVTSTSPAVVNVTSKPVLTKIDLTPTNPTLNIGQKTQLTAVSLDQNNNPFPTTFKWSSNNTGVATVSSSGLVTALKPGTANITASSGTIKSNISVVTVLKPVLTTINLSPAISDVVIGGKTKQISATTLDQNGKTISATLTWSSSNTSVATVNSSGVVTAVGLGTANITASSGNIISTSPAVVNTINPIININSVPKLGETGNASGNVVNLSSSNYSKYAVAVYINVNGGWWNKPYFNAPATKISTSGTWKANITTGGNDVNATKIRAYLVPLSFSIPLVSGSADLPVTLNSYAFDQESR